MTTDSRGHPVKVKRWRLTVHYELIWKYSLADGERQFHVVWNEAENRYDFSFSAYVIKQSSYYEDGNLVDDSNKTYTSETAIRIRGYFYGNHP